MTILRTVLVVSVVFLTGLVVVAVFGGCSAGWNDPHQIVKEVGNPCGLDWHSCGNGRCCYDGDDCRPSGGCAWGGLDNPTTWGASKDAGAAEYPQQTPEQVRRSRGRL